jgi:UDP-glucose 4-epimerase
MLCLVTGGAGFIGGHLVDALVQQKHKVVSVDNLAHGGKWRTSCVGITDDIRDDTLWQYIRSIYGRFDCIFHMAAVSRTVPAIQNPTLCLETNVIGTQKVLEYARQTKTPRVVVSSSNVVYAGCTPYRMSKLAAESITEVYSKLYGVSTIALRYSNVYGPRIPRGDAAVFAALRDQYQEKGYVEITGDGLQTRDFSHVYDIVRANRLAGVSKHQGVFDICTGTNTTLLSACALLGRTHPDGPREIPVRHVADRTGDVKEIVQNPAISAAALGYIYSISLAVGMRDVWTID